MSECRVKKSIVLKTKEKMAVLTPINSNSSLLVTITSEERSLIGRVHVSEIVQLLEGSIEKK